MVGSISNRGASEVVIASLALPQTDMMASGLFTIQCTTIGFQHTISFHAGAMYRFTSATVDSSITVHQNLCESDTPAFQDVRIREDVGGLIYLLATVSVPIDVTFYMDLKTTKWDLTSVLTIPPAGTDLTSITTNNHKHIETDNEIKCLALTSESVSTLAVNTNIVNDNGAGIITINSDTDLTFNNIQNVNNVDSVTTQTQILTSTLPQVAMGKNLSFVGGKEIHNLNIITQDTGVNLQLTEGLDVQSDVVMNDNGITGLASITNGTNPNITISGNLDLQTNDLQAVRNIYVDNVRTPVVFHDTLNMSGNQINNLGNPTQPNDGANKGYVDGLVTGFVTNPLTSDLDGGNFDITNITDLSADGIVNFSGTTTITNLMDIQANTDFTNTRVEHIDGGSQVWLYADSANRTMNFTDSLGKLTPPTWPKGATIFLIGSLFNQTHTATDHIMTYGRPFGSGVSVEKVIMPTHTHQLACKDCNDFAEGGIIPASATTWDSTNNGQEVTLKSWDVARQLGVPYGSGLVGQVQTPYAGMITGFTLKNAGALWNYVGGATITIKIGGAPVFTGNPLSSPPFFTFALPENLWVGVVAGSSFPDLTLEINTPNPGDLIDNFGSNPLEATYTFVQDITN